MTNNIIKGYSEAVLTIAVADYLRGEIHKGRNIIKIGVPFPNLLFTFVANEGRNAADGAKFQRFGVKRGVSDFIFWWKIEKSIWNKIVETLHLPTWFFACHTAGIELKTETGKQSPYQRDFEGHMRALGGQYAVCRTVAEVRDALIAWGLECKNMNCLEPRASLEIRKTQAHDYFAPR